jgi:hypothetical protein
MAITDAANKLTRRVARDWNPPSWKALLVTLPWVVGLAFFSYSFIVQRAIAGRQQITAGVIRTHDPANHNSFGYEFSVNGKLYVGSQIPSREYKIGHQVLVYYDPRDPTTSSLDSFTRAADQSLGPVFFCSLFAVATIVVIFSLRRDHARKSRRADF